MAHISLSPAVAAFNFSPIEKSFDRITKEGVVPQVNFLLGSQYNIPIGGETSITSEGSITNDTALIVTGKLELTAESTDGSEVEKIMSFSTFMYFYPGVRIVGQNEIDDDSLGPSPPTQIMRYEFEDLSTTDKLRVDLQSGDTFATFTVKETVDGVETTLVTKDVTAGVTNIKWEISYLESGLTKIFYKEPNGERIRIFEGVVNAKLGEAKVSARYVMNEQSTKTVKSDFIWIYYPNLFVGSSVALADRLNGRVRVFDTNDTDVESDWTEVFATDHPFVGERVIQNGLIRLRFKPTPKMEVYGWNVNDTAWQLTGSVIPKSTLGDVATSLKDIILDRFNDIHVKAIVKYGLVTHIVNVRRGQPVARIVTDSKEFRINTAKNRFVVPVNDVAVDLLDWNQQKSDNTNEGNPLNLSPTVNPFIFTNDVNVVTGLQLVNDNWYGWYDTGQTNEMVGFLGVTKQPTGLTLDAVSATELNNLDFSFDVNVILCVGIIEGDTNTKINGIPKVFNIGEVDEYVKWRANEGIYGFDQRGYVKKKR